MKEPEGEFSDLRPEVGFSKFEDGLWHARRVASDGVVPRPLCGAESKPVKGDVEQGHVCDVCVPLMLEELHMTEAQKKDFMLGLRKIVNEREH